jgi:dipeptidyl aminopeptidase/acylaminoacyl peptidase
VPAQKIIASTQFDSSPQLSPDQRRIAFRSSRSGHNEIWLADADGGNQVRLTYFNNTLTGTPRWSPDGQMIACDSRPDGPADIFTIDAVTGTPRRITNDKSEDVVPSFSRDGAWIYFASNRGGSWQVWKKAASGEGPAHQVTRAGGFAAFESPDGRWVYYAKGRSVSGLWRVPAGGGAEEPVLADLKPGYWGYWAICKAAIIYADASNVYSFNLAGRQKSLLTRLEKPTVQGDSGLAAAPECRPILISQTDQSGSDIMMVETR